MTKNPKTIQIFLPGGDPQGIRIAEITTHIVQVIEVPRSLLPQFLQMPESDRVALYFLIGKSDEEAEPRVYIGQTGSLRQRLASHNKDKDFWQKVLVVISKTNNLTQTHTLFLEWHCIGSTLEKGRYISENGNSGSKPHTLAPQEADCMEIFETSRTLLATLGYPIFDSVVEAKKPTGTDDVFYCKTSTAEGRGIYTQEGFVVLKGSVGRLQNAPSIHGKSLAKLRDKLIASGVMKEKGEQVIFEKDHLFTSPSTAAGAVLGRNTNGWNKWKNEIGQTLDAVIRQPKL